MAPNFRQNTQTRRGNRSGYVEHDDFDGLPTRQWRYELVTITPPPPPDPTRRNDVWAAELPHGMPKDSQLLSNHAYELLRASRSGRLYKRPAPADEEEAESDPAVVEKTEKKEEDPSSKGFQIRIWRQVARNAEGPTISYLAKRRKGTVTLSSDLPAGAAPGPTITRATVRRVDAAGNPYTQEVILNEGQPVNGEIISTTVVAAQAPAISVEAAVTPVRRRPPPPKRKPKGPGRGRKKKLPLPINPHTNTANTITTGLVPGVPIDAAQGLKPGDDASKHTDIEMADDDEADDGEDGEDDGEEGDDDDEEGEGADGETTVISQADSETKSDQMEITPSHNQVGEGTGTTSSSQEEAPLKHVISAQSPSTVSADSAYQEGMSKPSATLDSVEETLQPEASAPNLLQAVDATTIEGSSAADTMPTTNDDAGSDLDIEMQEATPTLLDTSTENILSNTVDESIAPTDIPTSSSIQPIESGGPDPTGLPVNEETENQATKVEVSPERAEIKHESPLPGNIGAAEDVSDEYAPADPVEPNVTDSIVESSEVAQVMDDPSIGGAAYFHPWLGRTAGRAASTTTGSRGK
ncbi:hypothetical protein NUW58_g3138 [Xylaria curta]|uniref:Uncharacterized protein n=1 Tax=Xylaria curta TaxID=42375 RepID=A0ACC1PCD2_9PEZI|nr:hypothetical protein NUW58_g3138 [Xylaria curta]